MDLQIFVGSRARVRKHIWSSHNSTLGPVITSENRKKRKIKIATLDNLVLLNGQNIKQYISVCLMKSKAFNSAEDCDNYEASPFMKVIHPVSSIKHYI